MATICLAALLAAGPAGAAVTIGQLPPSTPTASCPVTATDYLQPSVTSGNLYVAREAGTITSWSTRASVGSSQVYVLKVFRRTADPDVFQVVEHAPSRTLTGGMLNTSTVSLAVRSGDMLGFNAGGALNACTFDVPGDTVLRKTGDLSDGAEGAFVPKADSRLNLSAVLVPANNFTLGISRDRGLGTATVTAFVSNPGVVTVTGKGLKSGRAAKTVFVAGPVAFQIAATGKRKRKLERTGRVTIAATVTFTPTGGDPSSQAVTLRLKKRRTAASL